ncbi:MAG: helix-turn-helix transcriptional regulator [Candidatus Sericytochromatia bacterium]
MSFFGKELEQIRKRVGYTQYQLAKETNISRSHMNRVESGERNPTQEMIEKIVEVLKLDSYNTNKLLILADLPINIEKNSSGFKLCFRLALEFKNKSMFSYAQKVLDLGMKTFEGMIELHAILANTNLIKKQYDEAIKANEETLKLFDKLNKSEKKKIGISQAEIIHNLGYVYFERALENISKYEIHITSKEKNLELINNLKKLILSDLNSAQIKIEEAFNMEKDNFHILDQLARLYYRKAEFLEKEEKITYFNKAINYYEQLISTENNFDLPKKQEATIFMSLALAKIGKLDEAIRLINTIILFTNLYFLGYYAKSCIYAISSNNNIEFLDLSFNSLKEGLKLNSQLKDAIKFEPDLYNLINSEKFAEKFSIFFENDGEL